MARPQSCPGGQHQITWFTPSLGMCTGHQCVWRYDEGREGWGNLKGDWGATAVELGKALHLLMNEPRPVEADPLPRPPLPMPDPDSGRELLVQWRASMKVSQRQASVLLKISRSFIADIECGRKKISPKLWEKISNATP